MVQSIQLSPCWMWGQLRRLLLACRHDESYWTTRRYERNDCGEDGADDVTSFQVEYSVYQPL